MAVASQVKSSLGAILTVVAIVGGWYVLQRWVLPALGCET